MNQRFESYKEHKAKIKKIAEDIIYDNGEKMTRKQMQKLYSRMYETFEEKGESLFKKVKSILDKFSDRCKKEINNCNHDNRIELYVKLFKDYIRKVDKVANVFWMLSKKHDINRKIENQSDIHLKFNDKPEIQNYTFEHHVRKNWSDLVLNMKDKLVEAVFEDLQKERNGENQQTENRARAIIDSFIECNKDDLTLYYEALEEPIIEQVERHYKELSEGLASSKSSEEYFTTSCDLLQKERSLLEKNMPLSVDKIYRAAWNCLILDRWDIIKLVMKSIVQNENERENLKKCFVLMSETTKTLDKFFNEFGNHEKEMFLKLRTTTEDAMFCEKFLERYEKIDNLIKSDYNNDTELRKVFDKAIEKSLNGSPNQENGETKSHNSNTEMSISKIPNLVANYCDHILKKGTLGLSDVEVEKKLDGAMNIFKYMKDKDIFNRLYTKYLGTRLIDSTSQSIDTEQAMLVKLKNECGNDYVTRPEKMIKDYKVSLDETKAFKTKSKNSLQFSFNIMILQSGSWPIGTTRSGVLVPEELEKVLHNFNNFYVEKFNGRKLLWNHDLSWCEVKFNCLKKTYTMHMSVTTLTILMTFNTNESIAASDLASMTGIELEELSKFLRYLVKEKILLCKDDDIVEQSTITLNDKYENKRNKFKLKPQLRDQKREVEQTLKSVESDRKFFLQALIVRIMKGSKTMAHNDLVNEVVKLSISNFAPSSSMIKKTISYLIDKEYMESKKNVYHYVA